MTACQPACAVTVVRLLLLVICDMDGTWLGDGVDSGLGRAALEFLMLFATAAATLGVGGAADMPKSCAIACSASKMIWDEFLLL